jgi:hypothetical protein
LKQFLCSFYSTAYCVYLFRYILGLVLVQFCLCGSFAMCGKFVWRFCSRCYTLKVGLNLPQKYNVCFLQQCDLFNTVRKDGTRHAKHMPQNAKLVTRFLLLHFSCLAIFLPDTKREFRLASFVPCKFCALQVLYRNANSEICNSYANASLMPFVFQASDFVWHDSCKAI